MASVRPTTNAVCRLLPTPYLTAWGTHRTMNARHETFAVEYLACAGNASEAYRRTYPRSRNWKAKTLHNRASELLARGDVSGRIAELREIATGRTVISYQRALEIASRIANDPDASPRTILAALDRLARFCGWDKPQRVAVAGDNTQDLAAIKEAFRTMTPEALEAWLERNMP